MAVVVEVLADKEAVSGRGAAMVAGLIGAKPTAVLGLAAGATPLKLYAELVHRHADGLDFSDVTVFDLDEYIGLPPGHAAEFARGLHEQLIDRVNLAPGRVHLLGGGGDDDRCVGYEETIAAAGGIDLQILGIGLNGHIAFNEPGSPHDSRTRRVRLTETTRAANQTRFPPGQRVPETAVTMGIGTILGARRILLLATGEDKADAVAKALDGPVTDAVPASALQRHPDAVILLDRAAASQLRTRT